MDNDTEAPKDPGVCNQRYTEQDYEGIFINNIITRKIIASSEICGFLGHRAHTVFVGVHMPNSRRHSHRRHKHHHREGDRVSEYDRPSEYNLIQIYRSVVKIFLWDKTKSQKPKKSHNFVEPNESDTKFRKSNEHNSFNRNKERNKF